MSETIHTNLGPLNLYENQRCRTYSSYSFLTHHLLKSIYEPNCSNVNLTETNKKSAILITFIYNKL